MKLQLLLIALLASSALAQNGCQACLADYERDDPNPIAGTTPRPKLRFVSACDVGIGADVKENFCHNIWKELGNSKGCINMDDLKAYATWQETTFKPGGKTEEKFKQNAEKFAKGEGQAGKAADDLNKAKDATRKQRRKTAGAQNNNQAGKTQQQKEQEEDDRQAKEEKELEANVEKGKGDKAKHAGNRAAKKMGHCMKFRSQAQRTMICLAGLPNASTYFTGADVKLSPAVCKAFFEACAAVYAQQATETTSEKINRRMNNDDNSGNAAKQKKEIPDFTDVEAAFIAELETANQAADDATLEGLGNDETKTGKFCGLLKKGTCNAKVFGDGETATTATRRILAKYGQYAVRILVQIDTNANGNVVQDPNGYDKVTEAGVEWDDGSYARIVQILVSLLAFATLSMF